MVFFPSFASCRSPADPGVVCVLWLLLLVGTPPEMNLKFCLVLERMTAVLLTPGTDVVEILADPAGGWLAVPEFIGFHYQCRQ